MISELLLEDDELEVLLDDEGSFFLIGSPNKFLNSSFFLGSEKVFVGVFLSLFDDDELLELDSLSPR